jgi:NTE family protein
MSDDAGLTGSDPGSPRDVPRIGLVLGAGGLVGEAFHRGILNALNEVTAWDARHAEIIVGTSAGSLMGASLRAPAKADGVYVPAEQADVPRLGGLQTLRSLARRPWQARAMTIASSLLPAGTRSTDVVSAGLHHRYGARWADKDFWAVAVRWSDGRRVVFGREGEPRADIGSAVAASCAIPGYFRPVVIDGVAYVDGGVHSPTNADLLVGRELDLVIVSSPMSVAATAVRPKIDLSLRLLWHRYLVNEVRQLRRSGTPVIAFEPGSEALSRMSWNSMSPRNLDTVEDGAWVGGVRQLRHPRNAALRALLSPRMSDSA